MKNDVVHWFIEFYQGVAAIPDPMKHRRRNSVLMKPVLVKLDNLGKIDWRLSAVNVLSRVWLECKLNIQSFYRHVLIQFCLVVWNVAQIEPAPSLTVALTLRTPYCLFRTFRPLQVLKPQNLKSSVIHEISICVCCVVLICPPRVIGVLEVVLHWPHISHLKLLQGGVRRRQFGQHRVLVACRQRDKSMSLDFADWFCVKVISVNHLSNIDKSAEEWFRHIINVNLEQSNLVSLFPLFSVCFGWCLVLNDQFI